MGVCPAMHFFMLGGTELKLGMGVGGRPQVLQAYFQCDLIEGQRSSRGQVALEMAYGYQIW